jgi:hypothetical protein
MDPTNAFQQVFTQLKSILKKYERNLKVQADGEGIYYLNSKVPRKDGKPICFDATQIRKNYVSYYLMPVYGCEELAEGMSPELKARMQGKACFNFTSVSPALFRELAKLTKQSFERFRKIGWI